MRAISPAFGGMLIGVAVLWSLAYSMGDGNHLTEFVIALIGQAGDALAEAVAAVQRAMAGLQ